MKNKINKSLWIVAILLLTILTTNSCSDILNDPRKDKDTGEDVTLLLLDQNYFDSKITIHFKDEQGNLIDQDNLVVSLIGSDIDKIVNLEGKKKTSYNVSDGVLELAIDPNYTPSETSPINFTILAETEEFKWYCIPLSVSIINTGISDELVEMIYEGDDLKSAQINDAPFSSTISDPNAILIESDYPRDQDGYHIYYSYRASSKVTVQDISIEATDYTGLALNNYGFYGYFNSPREYFYDLVTKQEFDNISAYRFFAAEEKNVEKCSGGFVFRVTNEEETKGSAKFRYLFTFSDGSTKSGIITCQFGNTNQGGITYTAQKAISNIYVPVENRATTVELFPDEQYDFTSSSIITFEDGPCGKALNLSVVPKAGLEGYKLVAKVGCEGSAIGAAPTISGTFQEEGSQTKTNFIFNGGVATLQLKPNKNYEIVGKYNKDKVEFEFSTDPSKSDIVIANALEQFPEIKDIEIIFGEIVNGVQTIDLKVIYKSEHCPL